MIDQEISTALKNWLPIKLVQENNETCCRWLYLGNQNFDDPFFDETISKCRLLPENANLKKCVSSLDILPHWSAHINHITPAAIIFHVSRCGSTLLSQLLALNPANIALSEVPFFDDILRMGFRNNSMDHSTPMLKAAVTFYGAKRKEQQQNLFIKADSWHIHFYRELRQLYPQIPFILLYRKPDEVIRSHQRKRGMQAVPGLIEPGIFGFDKETISYADLNGYMTRVLETYYNAFIQILETDNEAFAFDYKEGMATVVQKMMGICGINISAGEIKLMEERGTRHAKFPEQQFAEDAINENPPAYLQQAFEYYYELEKLRFTHRPTS
jgi:hypothetical protein